MIRTLMGARIALPAAHSTAPSTSIKVRTTLAWPVIIMMSTATSRNRRAPLQTQRSLAPFAITWRRPRLRLWLSPRRKVQRRFIQSSSVLTERLRLAPELIVALALLLPLSSLGVA